MDKRVYHINVRKKQAIGTEAISISLIINFCLFLNVSGDYIFFAQYSGPVLKKKTHIKNKVKNLLGNF